MKRSSVVFFIKNVIDQTGHFYQHPQLGMVETYEIASHSVIVSLAEYLIWNFPRLHPAGFSANTSPKGLRGVHFPNYACMLHEFYPQWVELLCRCVETGNALRNGEECLYRVEIDEDYRRLLEKSGFTKTAFEGEFKWEFYSAKLQELPETQFKTFIFASCYDVNVRQFFYGEFFNNERWEHYQILKGQLPTEEDYQRASAIVVPGSAKSVYDKVPEIDQFALDINRALDKNRKLKYIGVCFGAQLLAHSLGGRVEKSGTICTGLQKIEVLKKKRRYFPFKWIQELFNSTEFVVNQYHGDHITYLPQGFWVVARS